MLAVAIPMTLSSATTPLLGVVATRDYLVYAALASVIGVFAFTYDGIYIGATWTRDMRNLMLAALASYLASWWRSGISATAAFGSRC